LSQPYPFTRDFELAVLRQVVADPAVLPHLSGCIEADRFPSTDVQLAFEAVLGYFKRIKRPPTSIALLQEVRGWKEAGKRDVVQQVAQTLDAAEEIIPVASEYVIEQVAQEARKVAVWKALDQGLHLHGQGNLEEIERVISAAVRIGRVDVNIGVDWVASLAERTAERKNHKSVKRWGTGVVELDDLLRGGLSAGELGVVVAAPGAGKSTFLVTVTTHVMNLGGTVVYYSFEMNEPDLVDRIDSAVTSIPMDELQRRAEQVQREVGAWLERSKGACVVKKFPARVTSVKEVRAHLEHLRMDRGIAPTVLVFDYADKMASNDGQRYEKDHQIVGAVYDEIRNLGAEFGCPVWTASQTNAEGDEAKVAGGHHIARSREKWSNADVMISINRTDDEKANEQVRFHIIKARYAADGVTVGPLRSDYARGRCVPLVRRA
jgi:replicative DNA helicase